MISSYQRRNFNWESAGQELGATLNGYHAIVVIGIDPVATGRVALGIGRAQAKRRRVAVGDLFAESPPIQELVHTEDPHGLVDSFVYGVSLSRIAYEVPGAGQLFVMPSGSEAPDYDEILPNPRWHRLAAGFAEVGALLVLAAPANAPHIEDLVAATDGAILVGEAVPRKLPVARVLTSIREPGTTPDVAALAAAAPAPAIPPEPGFSSKQLSAIAGVVLAVIIVGLAVWLAYRPLARFPRTVRKPADTVQIKKLIVTDTAVRQIATDTASAPTIAMPEVADPADSASAVAFAVELMAANTQAGAILKLQQDGKQLPAATFAPVLVQGARWFKVIAGAYANQTGADSLLGALRRRKVVDAGSGTVVRLPFAFLIDSAVRWTAVPGVVATYADHGQPVYALRQTNGTAWLFAGAFESLEQASLYAESLRASGITPVLVYRKGRMF